MNSRRIILSCIASLVVFTSVVAQSQTVFYKADNNDSLDLGTSWTNNLGIGPGASDTAVWDFNVATAANCTNIVGSPIWGGIRILNPATPVQVTSTGTLTLGGAGQNAIDMSGASQDLWLALSVSTAADQNWVIPNGRTLSVGGASLNVKILNNVGINGHLAYMRNLQVQGGGTLFLTNSATTIELGAGTSTTTPIVVGNDGTTVNNVIQTAGTVKPKRTDGTTGSPKVGMQIAGAGSSTGIYTITGGSIQDASTLNTSSLNIGDGGSSANGTLNVDGTASVTFGSIRLANALNAIGTINLTNGTVTVTGGSFDVGRTTSAVHGPGTLNVYGGTLRSFGGMDLPHGNGPGFFNLYGGNAFLNSMNLAASGAAVGNGILTINGGSLTVTNSINLPNGVNGTGTINLNGGTLTVNSLAHPGTASGTVVFNGGTLKPRGNQGNLIANGITANVGAGGAVIDTAEFAVTIPAALLNGTGGGVDGGVTKLGSGTLTLAGANTYTGPTRVNAGALYLDTTKFAGGSISVSNAALLHFILGSTGSTLNCSAISLGTLGASSGGALTLEFDLNGFANPAIPVVNTPSLSAAGTVAVNVVASGLGAGTYHLIQYTGSVGGSDFAFAANVLGGAVGYVTNNTATHYIDMVVTGTPSLVWRAQVNTNWDIGATANWLDLTNGSQTTYPNGAAAFFDDSANSTLVYVTATVSPAALAMNNTAADYTFTGVGRISGVTSLLKQGTGMVTMGVANDYTGDTVISNGTFRLGASGVIPDGTGKGDVALEGKLDLAGFSEGINGLSGNNGVIDNSGGGAVTLTIGNGGGSGIFAGQITNSTGSLALAKTGGGSLTLLARNGYSGGTTVGGVLQLAYEQSIGTGPLSLGGTLLWTDTAAHTLTNPVTITGGSTLGANTNGPLTIAGTANFAGGGRNLTCGADVSFPNGFANGWLSGKGGTGSLTVKNTTSHNPGTGGSGTIVFGSGATLFDNCLVIQEQGNIRIRAGADNQTSRLVLTNGSALMMTNVPSNNLRFNDGGSFANTTNIIDVGGRLTVMPYPGSSDRLQMGSSSDLVGENILNLLPGGVLQVKQVLDLCSASYSIVNFNGGILSPSTNDYASSFMQGLDYCYVQNGGAIIDTAGWDITIGQQLLAGGSGGLTKQGAGTLTLNPDPYSVGLANTYTGDTIVLGGTLALAVYNAAAPSKNWVVANGAVLDMSSAGGLTLNAGSTLKGTGTVLGFVYANPGGVVAPGTPAGTLVLEYGPALNGTLQMNLYRSGSTVTSGRLAVINGALNFGGVLTVSSIGGALRTGDTFKLFDAVSYSGAFTQTNLPAGVTWDLSNLYVDGTIKVQNAPAPKNPTFSAPALAGGNLVLTGSGGGAGSPYYVLSSTNMALPLSLWTPILTNVFAADGKFTNSIAVDPTKSALFFDIEVP